ncbi:unnamed protein product [Anisakis simplex]|uniref:DUF148 domain-containing protein n=1 Tax=Anisakis simplex TaxID=6269 RepID=A0A0M3K3V7_ANISI|nr:unnamed protein product [Anisakis simplex]
MHPYSLIVELLFAVIGFGASHEAPAKNTVTSKDATKITLPNCEVKATSPPRVTAAEEFLEIISMRNKTVDEIEKQFRAWADKQGGDVKENYNKAAAKLAEIVHAVDEVAESSPLEAHGRAAFDNIEDLLMNRNETIAEEIRTITDYVKQLANETSREMREFIQNEKAKINEKIEH